MLYPSVEFNELFRLKGKSRKMFGIKPKTFFFNFDLGDLQSGSHLSPTPLGCALVSSAFNNIRYSTWQARALAKQTKQVD